MKNINSYLFCFLLITISTFAFGQTQGTLTCSFTTTSSGGYTPKHLLAVWIENSSGTFIKTKMKYSSTSNYDHLANWTSKSNKNTVDALTGATLNSHSTRTFTWDGTNISGTQVADGPYKIWIELAWGNSMTSGKITSSYSFTKGVNEDHQTPSGNANLSNIKIDWVPKPVNHTIATSNLGSTTFCSGANVKVPFTISGETFNTGNIFTAQLSDANGSFATPVNIGTKSSITSDTINATIPLGTVTGNGYRIRVTGSNPIVTGSENDSNLDITLTVTPSLTLTQTPSGTVCPEQIIRFKAIPVNGGLPVYEWKIDGLVSGTSDSILKSFKNGQVVSCLMTSSLKCVTSKTATASPVTVSIYNVQPVTITLNSGKLISSENNGNQWYEESLGAISGANNNTFTPTNSGKYYVIVTDAHGCKDTSNVIHYYSSSISDEIGNYFGIYPNPSNGTINFNTNITSLDHKIRVENLPGKTIGTYNYSTGISETIDLSNYSDGMYFMVINTKQKELRFKFILKK